MKTQIVKGERFRKAVTTTVKQANDAERTIEHVITVRIVDRDGDVIEPRGVRLDNYRKSPIVLFGHEWWGFPVGRSLEQQISDQEIVSLTQFAGLDQASEEAEKTYRLVRDGFLPSCSIGFMPITWSEDKALPAQEGWWIKEWELLEYSIVSIPSNPAALVRLSKAYGLPNGATERDLADALRKDRKIYWDLAAAIGKGDPEPPTPAAVVPLVESAKAGRVLAQRNLDRLKAARATLDTVIAEEEAEAETEEGKGGTVVAPAAPVPPAADLKAITRATLEEVVRAGC